jgi:hypothetical protein
VHSTNGAFNSPTLSAPSNNRTTFKEHVSVKTGVSSWTKDNWDKVLAAFLAVVVAGVIGFFAAILTLKDDIAHLREEITKLESERRLYETKDEMKPLLSDFDQVKTKLNEVVMPTLKQLSAQESRISTVEFGIVRIEERSTILQRQTDRVLDKFALPPRR